MKLNWNWNYIISLRKFNMNTKTYAGNKYPAEILNLIQMKRRARRRWQQSRSLDDKTVLNRLTQNLGKEINQVKEKSFNLTADKESNYSLWKATRNLENPILQIPPIRKKHGNWAKNNKEKAETFADHLGEVFMQNDIKADLPKDEVDNRKIEHHIASFSQREIRKEIKTRKSKKAPGFDLITADIPCQLSKKGLTMITFICKIKLKNLRRAEKIAEIIMIPKPGKPLNEAKSYRPISLLRIISKVFEKLVIRRMKVIIEERGLIPNYQFGSRPKHSMMDEIHRIIDVIEKTFKERKMRSTIFLNVAQALDKVWHEGLLYKIFAEMLRRYSVLISFR